MNAGALGRRSRFQPESVAAFIGMRIIAISLTAH